MQQTQLEPHCLPSQHFWPGRQQVQQASVWFEHGQQEPLVQHAEPGGQQEQLQAFCFCVQHSFWQEDSKQSTHDLSQQSQPQSVLMIGQSGAQIWSKQQELTLLVDGLLTESSLAFVRARTRV